MSLLMDLVTGAAFGSALTFSGVWSPSVIISQMQFRDFHMVQAFMGASAASALIVYAASKTGYSPVQVRSSSTFANLPPYFGNILGGLGVGVGMALTGACPGTVIVQSALGIPSGLFVALGGLLGGITFVKLAKPLRHTSSLPKKSSSSNSKRNITTTTAKSVSKSPPAGTITSKLGVNDETALLAYEAMCALMIGLAVVYAPSAQRPFINPIIGGLAIGGAQALSVLLSRKTVGVSTAYEQLAQDFWGIVLPSSNSMSASHSSVTFAAGVFLGAKALATYLPLVTLVGETNPVQPLTAVVGGAVMVFGARLAGGCTSGHGISGMATISVSSFVTVASMFAGGMGLRFLMG